MPHELESANRDMTLNQSDISQQSFQTTANVVALGNSVGFPGSIPAPFGARAEDRLFGTSLSRKFLENVPDTSNDAHVDDLSVGWTVGRTDGLSVGPMVHQTVYHMAVWVYLPLARKVRMPSCR